MQPNSTCIASFEIQNDLNEEPKDAADEKTPACESDSTLNKTSFVGMKEDQPYLVKSLAEKQSEHGRYFNEKDAEDKSIVLCES